MKNGIGRLIIIPSHVNIIAIVLNVDGAWGNVYCPFISVKDWFYISAMQIIK